MEKIPRWTDGVQCHLCTGCGVPVYFGCDEFLRNADDRKFHTCDPRVQRTDASSLNVED